MGILETDNYDGRLNVFINLRFLLKLLKIIVSFFIDTDVFEFQLREWKMEDNITITFQW